MHDGLQYLVAYPAVLEESCKGRGEYGGSRRNDAYDWL